MTWRLGPVDQRTGGGRPPDSIRTAVLPWRSGLSWPLSLLGLVVGAVLLLAVPVPAASAADTCANASFRTGASANLPDCRAYEQVTPADKGHVTLQYTLTHSGNVRTGYPSVDGQHFLSGGIPPFADPVSGLPAVYISDRTGDGWVTRNTQPKSCLDLDKAADFFNYQGASVDFSTLIFSSTQNCDPGDDAGGDLFVQTLGRPMVWISHNGEPKTQNMTATFGGASADAGHIVFSTPERLVLPIENGRTVGNGLYDYSAGKLVPVALKDDGSLLNPCGASSVGGSAEGAVSADGRVIFFVSGSSTTVPGCSPTADEGGQLYARIGAAKTVEISRSVATTPDTAGRKAPTFLAATRNGATVFFRSSEALTDTAPSGGGLYEYDLSAVLSGASSVGTLRFVGTGPTIGTYAIVLAGLSDDGSVAYFVSTDVLASGATNGAFNLYVADHGAPPVFVTVLPNVRTTVSVSPNGSRAVYSKQAPDGTTQIYRYTLGESDTPCVSCPGGAPATGDALLYGSTNGLAQGRPRSMGAPRFVTDDGRVYFNSPDRLDRGDVNSRYDVYEYKDGRQKLLSAGTGPDDSLLMGVTDDGSDVFFATNDSLVGQDFDNGDQDIYDVRVGGGFPAPGAPPASCAGDACQPQALVPVLSSPGSMKFVAPFALVPRTARAGKAAKEKLSVRRPTTVRGSTKVRLSVKAPDAGRIRVSGSGLRRAKKAAKTAKTYRVTVKLSKRSKRILKRKHRVRVRATVRFTPRQGRRSRVRVHVTFKTKEYSSKASRRSHHRTHGVSRKGGR